jgi:DNA polymerase-3 subunit delta
MNAWYVKGEDPALVVEEVRKLVRELAGDDAMAVEDLSGEDVQVATIVDACLTPPFLGDRRVVVAREIGRFRSEELEPLIQWLADPLPTTSLVLTAGGGQVSQKLVNAIKKVGKVVDASVPSSARARTSWLTNRLHEGPVRLDAAAGALVGEHLGEDMGRLNNLLESLAAAYGDGAHIGVEEIAPFLGQAGGVAPWDLTDAIDAGDTEAALSYLHRMLAAGERHPLVVLATLHRHYQAMLKLDGAGVRDENEAAALLGTSPFPAKKAMNQARRLQSGGIAKAIAWLADADLDLRGAKAWPDELILDVLVARLSRLVPRPAGGGGRRTAPSAARRR